MITMTNAGAEALRARFGTLLAGRLPGHIQRLDWDAEQLAAHQRDQLRKLLAHAVQRSPFHARRLRGIDPSASSSTSWASCL